MFANSFKLALRLAAAGAVLCTAALAQVNVTTYHYDNNRTGWNPSETHLTTANVNDDGFGMLYALPVDGAVYAQPLYVTGVNIPGKGVHNVLYVCTENNSVYAFDASSASPTLLWQVNLGPSVSANDVGSGDLQPIIGITATPVIHLTGTGTGYMYLIAKTKESDGNGGFNYVQRLHALNIQNGHDPVAGPTVISPLVYGTGDGNDGRGHVYFNPLIEHCRPALLYLQNGNKGEVVAAWASHGDNGPYHGWVMVFDSNTLKLNYVWNTTPNSLTDPSGYPIAAGGIWQGGGGLASDGSSIYFATGNGTYDPVHGGYGDAIVKLSPTLSVQDYFAPYNQLNLDDNDADVGSGGVMIIPNDPTYNPSLGLLVQMGKDGTMHVLNTSQFTTDNNHFNPNPSGPDKIWGELQNVTGGIWGAPAYFRGTMYFGPENWPLVTYKISHGVWVAGGVQSQSPNTFGYPGPTPSVSSNGNGNGIVWAVDESAYVGSGIDGPAQLYAYDATNITRKLYSSTDVPGRDLMGTAVKFVTPLVDGGRVYVGTQTEVDVFGLGKFCANPVIGTASGTYNSPINVSVTESTQNAKVYYTLDGTIPTTSSTQYTGPINISSNATLTVKAFATGLGPSGAVAANYLISPTVGNGDGLTGAYYGNMNLTGSPTVTEIDPTINFDWNGDSPVNGVPGNNWSGEWTGTIEPLGSGNYKFYTTSDDGVRLWINGNLVIDDWTDHGSTVDTSAAIALVGGQKYSIKLDFYQDQGGSLLQLSWSSPGLPTEIVPTSQMYDH